MQGPLFLQKADIDPEDILLERREPDTNFTVSFQIGIEYSFGSLYTILSIHDLDFNSNPNRYVML